MVNKHIPFFIFIVLVIFSSLLRRYNFPFEIMLIKIALSIIIFRIIMLQGRGGCEGIITATGDFLVGGNYIVGIILFLVSFIFLNIFLLKYNDNLSDFLKKSNLISDILFLAIIFFGGTIIGIWQSGENITKAFKVYTLLTLGYFICILLPVLINFSDSHNVFIIIFGTILLLGLITPISLLLCLAIGIVFLYLY